MITALPAGAAASTSPAGALRVHNLGKTYATAAQSITVLRDCELSMQRGEALAVTGPSGSGKSTLLYLLGGLEPPTTGTIEVLGQNPWQMTARQQARYRNEQVGYVFQDHHLLPQCSVLENVLIPTLPLHGANPENTQRARELLGRVGLSHRLTHRPGELSGGERQRVAVCRALINRPVLLLADEPTGNLDRTSADAVGTLLLELAEEQQAILLCVTHSLELAGRFPRAVELRDGQLQPASPAK